MAEEKPQKPVDEKNERQDGIPSIRRKVLVTEEGLDDFLSDDPLRTPFGPLPDTFIPGGHPTAGGTHDGGDSVFTTDHVGRDLKGKTQPLRAIDDPGPDPYADRFFTGDEFQGMLLFDKEGRPAFWSRFPEAGNDPANIKEYKISIATTLPSFMTEDTPQRRDIQDMEEDAFDGKPIEDAFARIDETTLEQIHKYAEEFEAAYGIKLTVSFDDPDAHLTVMGYQKGDPELLGWASFPPGVNDWEATEGLGHHPAFMMLNNQYTGAASEKEIYDLFSHEFGHTYGLAHPHDLAILNMGKRESLTATKMAYTDLKLQAFRHLVTDASGNPKLDENGEKQYTHFGPDEGVLDYGMRKWLADTPALDHVSNPDPEDPENDLYNGVYDLEAHLEQSVAANQDSLVFRRERLLPMVPMLNDGKNTVLKGSQGDDYIDTNPGYSTILKDPTSGATQKFVLVEGHMEKVLGMAGDNTIIPAHTGDQEIHPGPGKNNIQLIYPSMQGHKDIRFEGRKDTLTLSEKILDKQKITAEKGEDGIRLKIGDASVTLGGSGPEFLKIINSRGRNLFQIDIRDMSAEEINRGIFKDNAWKKAVETSKPEEPEITPPPTPTITLPEQGRTSPEDTQHSWAKTIADERESPAKKPGIGI